MNSIASARPDAHGPEGAPTAQAHPPNLDALEEPIARGRSAEVYPWGEGQVLKLFRAGAPPGDVARELRASRVAHAAGLPAPAVGDSVEIGGRQGIVYERIEGRDMGRALQHEPWTVGRLARLLAELHAQIHAVALADELPAQRERLAVNIGAARALPEDLRAAALEALQRLPDGDRLCHGDLWPAQVMLTPRGPVILDWLAAMRGNPLADVARSSVILEGARAQRLPWIAKLLVGSYHRSYVRRYLQLKPGGREELRRWRPIVAAARLNEEIPGLQAWLLGQVRAGLPGG